MILPPPDSLFAGSSEIAALLRATDWSRTPLGAIDGWSQSVRAILRMMLTSRYAMWMGWGSDLRFFYNDAYARMTLGAKHPWALGRPAREVWSEIWPEIGPRIERVLATGEATWDEGLRLFLERSGYPEETYHTFSYSPVHDDAGRIAGMFCVVTEETTRVIGERRLALLRDLAAQLSLTQTSEELWGAVERSLDSDARDLPFTLTYLANEADGSLRLVASSGIPPGSPIAPDPLAPDEGVWPAQQVLDPPARTAVVDLPAALPWPRGPWDKAPARALVVPIAQQGQARAAGLFVAGLNPYRPFDREYESFVVLYVGQLAAGLANAQAYAAERRRGEALAQLDRAKTTFFSNVSHELRTPLTLMLAPVTDALAAGARGLEGEALALVHRNGLRLQKLVNTLLDFTRIEAGRIDASYEPVDLAALTSELASTFEAVTASVGLRLAVDCEAGGEPTYVDRDMWEKIVFNLISNAFKFTFEGEIAVSVRRVQDRMALRVRDTGIGIPAPELPRIFERFHRVEGARGRTHEGTGIGLALVHELVKLHSGTIAVESEPGRGTAFTVTVPLGTAHLHADRLATRRGSGRTALGADVFVTEAARWLPGGSGGLLADEGPSAPEPAAAEPIDGSRIVLAEDNADMRAYLSQLLGSRWQVDAAVDGAEALRLVGTRPPDLVITDVMMPTLDGFGLLRALREDAATRHVPVMMLSARAGEESRIEGFQAGADDYVVKPFTARELVARVQAQLLRARMRAVEDEQRRRLGEVFEHAPVAVAILRGPTHVFELANPAYLDIIQRTDVVGRPLRDALPELRSQRIIEVLDEVYRSGREYVGRSQPIWLRRGPDGALQERFFDFVFQPFGNREGRIEGIAAVGFDVTELATARRAAEEANRAKDEFLAMLGHELRNPLAPILTALQLLRLRGIEAGERERSVIERQVRHLVGLVDDLLDVSRITRGKIRLTREPIELTEVLAKAIELASPLLEQHQHALTIDVPRHGLGIMADPARLAQVVSNLLTNAAKYTPPGGSIRVGAHREGREVVLRIADTGIGIDPEMLPHIFDLFTQDRQAIDRAQGGLGLGLAIVRSLVSLHGGTVSAHSAGRGRGSEFAVRLPHVDAHQDAGAAGDALRPRTPDGAALRVLVVDDNPDAAAMLAEILRESGHATAVAHDGPTALDTAARFGPDVALLDIGLPVMDGFELARHFRAAPGLQGTRLVAVTGYGQEHDRRQSSEAGFDAHLVKPVDFEQLSTLMRQFGGEARSDSGR